MSLFNITAQFTTIQILLSHMVNKGKPKEDSIFLRHNVLSLQHHDRRTSNLALQRSFPEKFSYPATRKIPCAFENGIHKTPPMTRNVSNFPPIYTLTL